MLDCLRLGHRSSLSRRALNVSFFPLAFPLRRASLGAYSAAHYAIFPSQSRSYTGNRVADLLLLL